MSTADTIKHLRVHKICRLHHMHTYINSTEYVHMVHMQISNTDNKLTGSIRIRAIVIRIAIEILYHYRLQLGTHKKRLLDTHDNKYVCTYIHTYTHIQVYKYNQE